MVTAALLGLRMLFRGQCARTWTWEWVNLRAVYRDQCARRVR
jgi:hypothetical protein